MYGTNGEDLLLYLCLYCGGGVEITVRTCNWVIYYVKLNPFGFCCYFKLSACIWNMCNGRWVNI